MPALKGVNESARRVVCASNIRQIGFGVALYADDNRGFVPSSVFISTHGRSSMPEEMMTLRLGRNMGAGDAGQWDGLGLLYSQQYLAAAKLFYCPSHRGRHPYSEYASEFDAPGAELVSNYHYRGAPPNMPVLFDIEPDSTALVADGMRTIADFSHVTGANVLQANLSVRWVPDDAGRVASILARDEDETEGEKVNDAWEWIDDAVGSSDRPR
ncbi:MAG: hypothetical protein SFZ23_11015 [Planctomycetota bacterium]|nr:hypothetical protein [Planctomycetota bacterium]